MGLIGSVSNASRPLEMSQIGQLLIFPTATLSGGCVKTLFWKIRIEYYFFDALQIKQEFHKAAGKYLILEYHPDR